MNIADVIIAAVLAVIVGLAIRKIINDKKSGKTCSSCGGGANCSACASAAASLNKAFPAANDMADSHTK